MAFNTLQALKCNENVVCTIDFGTESRIFGASKRYPHSAFLLVDGGTEMRVPKALHNSIENTVPQTYPESGQTGVTKAASFSVLFHYHTCRSGCLSSKQEEGRSVI